MAGLAEDTRTDPPQQTPGPEEERPAPPQDAEPLIRDEAWILAQNPEHYTIQAIGMRDRETVVGLVEGRDALAPWAIYVVQRDTRPIYVLVQGAYSTVEAARAARDVFPRRVNRPDRVWIRQFGKIQALIRAESPAPSEGSVSAEEARGAVPGATRVGPEGPPTPRIDGSPVGAARGAT